VPLKAVYVQKDRYIELLNSSIAVVRFFILDRPRSSFDRLQKLFVDFSTLLGATPQPSIAAVLVGKLYGLGHTMFQIQSMRKMLWVLRSTQTHAIVQRRESSNASDEEELNNEEVLRNRLQQEANRREVNFEVLEDPEGFPSDFNVGAMNALDDEFYATYFDQVVQVLPPRAPPPVQRLRNTANGIQQSYNRRYGIGMGAAAFDTNSTCCCC